jgi:hypothetical protein
MLYVPPKKAAVENYVSQNIHYYEVYSFCL